MEIVMASQAEFPDVADLVQVVEAEPFQLCWRRLGPPVVAQPLTLPGVQS